MKLLTLIGITSALFGAFVHCSEAHSRPKVQVTPFDSVGCSNSVARKDEGITHKKRCQKFKKPFYAYSAQFKGDGKNTDCQLLVFADRDCVGQHSSSGSLLDISNRGPCKAVGLFDSHGHPIPALSAKLDCEPHLAHPPHHPKPKTTTVGEITVTRTLNPEPSTSVGGSKSVVTRTVTGTFEVTSEIPTPIRSTVCHRTTTTWLQTNTIVNQFSDTYDVCAISGILTTLGHHHHVPTAPANNLFEASAEMFYAEPTNASMAPMADDAEHHFDHHTHQSQPTITQAAVHN